VQETAADRLSARTNLLTSAKEWRRKERHGHAASHRCTRGQAVIKDIGLLLSATCGSRFDADAISGEGGRIPRSAG
jgi:hypothetical protein